MTLRWDLTEGDVYDIVIEVLVEEGWVPDQNRPGDESVLTVDVDEVAAIIARKLVAP